jgi:hypothetical protein
MEVDGDTLEGFWDAITNTESFTVCYDELLQGCYTVPGWGSPQMVIIFILELTFLLFSTRWLWKRVRKNGRSTTELDNPHRYDKGQG